MDCMPTPDASSAKACPICGKPAVDKYRPFCGRRCADVDLNRWLSDAYVLPATPDADDEAGPPELPDEKA